MAPTSFLNTNTGQVQWIFIPSLYCVDCDGAVWEWMEKKWPTAVKPRCDD